MEALENPNANIFYEFAKQKGIKFALEKTIRGIAVQVSIPYQ